MEEKLTPEMKEVIAKLGELVKADERCTRIQSTISDYEHSEELTALIGEYNTQQNLLADAYNKPEGDRTASEEFKSAVQARIDALYDQITTHPVYTAYVAAKNEFDALTQEIIFFILPIGVAASLSNRTTFFPSENTVLE